jgi:hypothetical protein
VNAVKVDEARRVRLPMLTPGDYYEPELRGEAEIVLRRVPAPGQRMTKEECLIGIERSSLRFTKSWDELKEETR